MYTRYMYFITYNRAYQVDQVSFIAEELLFQKELVAFEQIISTKNNAYASWFPWKREINKK